MDENALIMQRLGSFAERFRDYCGCPRGMIGTPGPCGSTEAEKVDCLKSLLTAQPEIKDIDGNNWVPVERLTLNMTLDALDELKKLRAVHRRFLEREKEAERENRRDMETGRCYQSDGGPQGPRGLRGPIGW